MRYIFLLIFITANLFLGHAKDFVVRVHVKDHVTNEHLTLKDYDFFKLGTKHSKSKPMKNIITETGDGALEMKFEKRPDVKDNYTLFINGRDVKSDAQVYETRIMSIYVPKDAKSPYDMELLMWRTNEHNTFDPAKSFTVIINIKDKESKEPINTNQHKVKVKRIKGENKDWGYDYNASSENGKITIVFKERPKANEKWEVWIYDHKDKNGEYEDKIVAIEIPENASSPYVLPDVMMQVKEGLEDWR